MVNDRRSWRRRLDDAAASPIARSSLMYELPLAIFVCALFAAKLLATGDVLIVAGLGGLAALAFAMLLRKR